MRRINPLPPNNVYDKAEDVKCSNYDSIKLMSKSEYFLFLLKPLCVLQGLFDPTFAKLKKIVSLSKWHETLYTF